MYTSPVISRWIGSLLLFPSLLLGQGASDSSVPDDILFRFFFLRISSMAASARAKGVAPSAVERAMKDREGFTTAEISRVHEIALSCNQAYDAKTRSGSEEVRRLAALNPDRTEPQPGVVARIDALERERAQVIRDCLDILSRSMGAVRYAKLNAYVRQESTVRYADPAKLKSRSNSIPPRESVPIPVYGSPQQGVLK